MRVDIPARRTSMPHFEPFYADKLRGSLGISNADAVLDLRAAGERQALASLAEMIERSRFSAPRTIAIRLAPPPEGGGETLFLPIGRALLEAKRKGHVETLAPLPAHDGLGFFVRLKGRATSA